MKRIALALSSLVLAAVIAACGGSPKNQYDAGYSDGYHHSSQFLDWANQHTSSNTTDWCNTLDSGNSGQWVNGCVEGVADAP